ncbi:MAG: AraC family transcriptional regulator [Bacteroidia bacterium]|nr:AraC family transcriptional regulator [Bacteroidia bacterium]
MKNKQEIIERVAKVVRHIEHNIDKEMPLEELASIACFSPFHFQRIFKEFIQETPKQFIKRLRLDESAHVIALYPEKSMIEVAIQCGFKSAIVFSRAFKDYYKISPDNFRKSSELEKIRICQIPNNGRKQLGNPDAYFINSNKKLEFSDFKVEIIKRPEKKFIYLQTSLDDISLILESFKKIYRWADVRGLLTPDTEIFGSMKDYPLYTPLDKCRFLTCISVETEPEVSGLICYSELPPTTYSCFTATGGITDMIKAVTYWSNIWLPESGYRVTHEHVITIPANNIWETPLEMNTHRIYIPVLPA